MTRRTNRLSTTLAALSALALAACGSGGGGGANTGDPLEDTLIDLGVDTDPGDRLDDTGNPYPANYSPFGAQITLNKTDEIFALGMKLGNQQVANTRLSFAQDELGVAEVLHRASSDPVWAQSSQSSNTFAQSMRAATQADVDGDGLEEIVVVYVDLTDTARDTEVTVVIYEDGDATVPFATTTKVIALEPGVKDVRVAAGDFDGDGTDDIAIGLGFGDTAKLLFAMSTAGDLNVNEAATQSLATGLAGWTIGLALATGNIDHDRGQELVVVINEYDSANNTGVARYVIYDSAEANHATIDSGMVQATDGAVYNAVVADVTLGDIDGDNVDEIVFGGLTEYQTSCQASGHLYMAIDDNAHGLLPIGAKYVERFLNGCPAFGPWKLRWVHMNAVDIDGDRVDEIQANGILFANWNDAAPFTERESIGDNEFLDSGAYGWYDRNTSAMFTGDVTGDGREDIVFYTQDTRGVHVFGDDQVNGFGRLGTIDTEFLNSQTPVNPILLPVNLDKDSLVLSYTEGEYKLIFTEPVVIAALAAAPCQSGIGQNLNGCYTTFGKAESASVTKEQVLSLSASVSAGFKVTGGVFTQSELEVKATVSTTASSITSESYTLTQSVVYTTGSLEDSVVFTTVPYDQYTYTVLSHPDPQMIGKEMVISFPRSPITLIAERGFYNSSILEDALHIGDEVFQHVPGDVTSYVSRAQKNVITGANGGIETPAQSVGQGTSSVEIGLAVGEEYSAGRSLEMGFEFSLQATGATVLAGFTVGASVQDTLTVTSGTETTYTGSIGSIDSANFSQNIYSYGLFTYVQADGPSGQQFEVVNYWVE